METKQFLYESIMKAKQRLIFVGTAGLHKIFNVGWCRQTLMFMIHT